MNFCYSLLLVVAQRSNEQKKNVHTFYCPQVANKLSTNTRRQVKQHYKSSNERNKRNEHDFIYECHSIILVIYQKRMRWNRTTNIVYFPNTIFMLVKCLTCISSFESNKLFVPHFFFLFAMSIHADDSKHSL